VLAEPVSEGRALPQGSGSRFTLLPLTEQAGNPDGSGTPSRRIGNPSHDMGTLAQVCSRQVIRTGEEQFVLLVLGKQFPTTKKGVTHRFPSGSAEGLTLTLMARVLAWNPDETRA